MRWAFALATAAVIAAGAIYAVRTSQGSFDAKFYGAVLAALLPTFVYLLGVREPRSSVVCGALLLGVTFLGWVFILQDDAMRGVGAVAAFPATLGISTGFAIHDQAQRRARIWQP